MNIKKTLARLDDDNSNELMRAIRDISHALPSMSLLALKELRAEIASIRCFSEYQEGVIDTIKELLAAYQTKMEHTSDITRDV